MLSKSTLNWNKPFSTKKKACSKAEQNGRIYLFCVIPAHFGVLFELKE
jgi:hypothetical protein